MPRSDISAVVLAGGKSSRMGRDKGLVVLEGIPLVSRAIMAFEGKVDEILISANRPGYAGLGFPVIGDDLRGPLSGVLSAMRAARNPFLLTIPCDTVFFPESMALRLKSALEKESASIAVARSAGVIHHAVMLLKRDLFRNLKNYLNSGERRVGEWQMSLPCAIVDFDEENAFFNINTPEDLARAASLLRRDGRT